MSVEPTIQLFTDVQFAALLGVIGTIATAAGVGARWAINRIVRAMDQSTEARIEAAKADSAQTAALQNVVGKVDEVHEHWIARTGTAPR